VVVGTVPCKIVPSNRPLVIGRREERFTQDGQDRVKVECVARSKQPRMISSSGREIVGPGYTTEPDIMERVAHGKARQEQNKKRSMETKIEMLNSQTEETLHRQSLGEDNSSQNKTKAAEAPDGAGAKTTPLGTKPLPRWCPTSLTKMQRPRVQKLRAREIAEKRRDEERDWWFNQE
jgi:hypothetical protein